MNKFYESRAAYKDILVEGFNCINRLANYISNKQLLAEAAIEVLEAIDKAASEYMLCHNNYVKELRKVGDELSAEDTKLHNIILDKRSYCSDFYIQLVEKYGKE